MALTFDQVVDRGVAQSNVARATVEQFANNRHQQLVARSEYLRKLVTLATTVADQSVYSLPSTVARVIDVRIGTDEYSRGSEEDVWAYEGGAQIDFSDGKTGFFAPYDDATGNPAIYVAPSPDTTGTAIQAMAIYRPDAISYGNSTVLQVPDEFTTTVLDGVLADVYQQEDERYDLAQVHDQKFEQGVQDLTRYRNKRVGRGPAQINWRNPRNHY